MELFPCLYHDTCVLRMSLLYCAFEVQSEDSRISLSAYRKIIELLFELPRRTYQESAEQNVC